jgi:RNA polymerase sigma-70 factor (ECF subfamily)
MQIHQQGRATLPNGTRAIDAPVFSEVHREYCSKLVNSITAVARNRQDAEDITATAFTAAFKNLDRFRGESSLYTWIHAIALNEVRSRRRNNNVLIESLDESDALQIAESDSLDKPFERAECCPRIWKALRRIPFVYRHTLIDRFVRGYSIKEIANRRRIPCGTVLSRLFRAKQLLRAAWES